MPTEDESDREETVPRVHPVHPVHPPPTVDKPPPVNATTPTIKITEDECFTNFKRFLKREKSGLRVFYPGDEDLKKHAPAAKIMVEKLFGLGCKKEVALQLSVLVLYDMVMLIGSPP